MKCTRGIYRSPAATPPRRPHAAPTPPPSARGALMRCVCVHAHHGDSCSRASAVCSACPHVQVSVFLGQAGLYRESELLLNAALAKEDDEGRLADLFHALADVLWKAQQARQGGGREFLDKVVTAARKSIALRRRMSINPAQQVCVYVCVCMMYACMHACMRVLACSSSYTHTAAAHVHQPRAAGAYTHIHTYMHVCLHACMHAYMHAYIHACMHACMHA